MWEKPNNKKTAHFWVYCKLSIVYNIDGNAPIYSPFVCLHFFIRDKFQGSC